MGVAPSPPPLRSKILSFHSTFADLFFPRPSKFSTQHTFRFSQKSPPAHHKKKKEKEEETEEEVKEEEEETEEK